MRGSDFFLLGGGKHVDMPSDGRDIFFVGGGVYKHILHLEMKSCPPWPPASAPLYTNTVMATVVRYLAGEHVVLTVRVTCPHVVGQINDCLEFLLQARYSGQSLRTQVGIAYQVAHGVQVALQDWIDNCGVGGGDAAFHVL